MKRIPMTRYSSPSRFTFLIGIVSCCLLLGACKKGDPGFSGNAAETRSIEGQIFIRTKGAETIKLSLVDVLLFDKVEIEEHLKNKRKVAEPLYEYLHPLAKQAEEEYDRADKNALKLQEDALGIAKKNRDLAVIENTLGEELLAARKSGFQEASKTAEAYARAARAEAERVLEAISARDGFDQALAAKSKLGSVKRKLRNAADYTRSADYYFNNLPQPMKTTTTDADGKFSFNVPIGSYVLAATSSRNAGAEIVGNSSFPKVETYHWMVKVTADADKKVMLANDNLSNSGSADSLISTNADGMTFDEIDFDEIEKGGGIHFVAAFIEEDKRERVAGAKARERERDAPEPQRQAVGAEVKAAQTMQPNISATESDRVAAEASRQESARQIELDVFRKDPKAAQLKAIELYPDVGVAGSPLNNEVVARMKRYQMEKKEFFDEPDWPIRLAKECSEDLAGK